MKNDNFYAKILEFDKQRFIWKNRRDSWDLYGSPAEHEDENAHAWCHVCSFG